MPIRRPALSRILFGQVAERSRNKRLVIIADGELRFVPFAALPDPVDEGGAREPLVVGHEIVSLPLAGIASTLRTKEPLRELPSKTLALIADPVFGKEDPRVTRTSDSARKEPDVPAFYRPPLRAGRESGVVTRAAGFPRLPLSRDKVSGILQFVPQGKSFVALGVAASRSVATSSELSSYRIVHFATHGLLDSQHPELSGLVFSLVNGRGEPVDGFLGLKEVYNLKLSADLVVLSACQTDLGKDVKGEGLTGLIRGFMYAGAPHVVASLWEMDDEATANLMRAFYAEMLGPRRLKPAEALRAAENAVRVNPRWQSPYYLAGFTIQGDWN